MASPSARCGTGGPGGSDVEEVDGGVAGSWTSSFLICSQILTRELQARLEELCGEIGLQPFDLSIHFHDLKTLSGAFVPGVLIPPVVVPAVPMSEFWGPPPPNSEETQDPSSSEENPEEEARDNEGTGDEMNSAAHDEDEESDEVMLDGPPMQGVLRSEEGDAVSGGPVAAVALEPREGQDVDPMVVENTRPITNMISPSVTPGKQKERFAGVFVPPLPQAHPKEPVRLGGRVFQERSVVLATVVPAVKDGICSYCAKKKFPGCVPRWYLFKKGTGITSFRCDKCLIDKQCCLFHKDREQFNVAEYPTLEETQQGKDERRKNADAKLASNARLQRSNKRRRESTGQEDPAEGRSEKDSDVKPKLKRKGKGKVVARPVAMRARSKRVVARKPIVLPSDDSGEGTDSESRDEFARIGPVASSSKVKLPDAQSKTSLFSTIPDFRPLLAISDPDEDVIRDALTKLKRLQLHDKAEFEGIQLEYEDRVERIVRMRKRLEEKMGED